MTGLERREIVPLFQGLTKAVMRGNLDPVWRGNGCEGLGRVDSQVFPNVNGRA